MRKKFIKIYSLIMLITIFLTGCATTKSKIENSSNSVMKISGEEAKSIIDSREQVIIIDVREESEYREGHIKDSVLVPLGTIEDKIEKVVEDKNQPILVYCRSGRRSAEAANLLNKLGYTNVYDFGGIIDWPYDIEK